MTSRPSCSPARPAGLSSPSNLDRAADPLSALTGIGPAVAALRREVASVAPLHSTVLVTGETGTGKGLVAKAIHRASLRGHMRMVHVDCASLSPTIIESELFGHERGAFTSAVSQRRGRFELAAGATLFLDEIGDLEPRLQSKLLRVLQDREYERLGGTKTLPMTARVIAATNCDLVAAVRDGRFRADLYYRLNVIPIHIPPLRERREDIPALVESGLAQLSASMGLAAPRLSAEACQRLEAHPWPGNVRELMNLLERLIARHSGERIEADALGLSLAGAMPAAGAAASAPPAVEGLEAPARDEMASVLRRTGGNVARAARELGIPRSTLRHRILRHGLPAWPRREP